MLGHAPFFLVAIIIFVSPTAPLAPKRGKAIRSARAERLRQVTLEGPSVFPEAGLQRRQPPLPQAKTIQSDRLLENRFDPFFLSRQ